MVRLKVKSCIWGKGEVPSINTLEGDGQTSFPVLFKFYY